MDKNNFYKPLKLYIKTFSFFFLVILSFQSLNKVALCQEEELHKRWLIKDKPFVWGKQKQYIDVGLQLDLFFKNEIFPKKKYLVIRTIGNGTSAGTMEYNKPLHRGFFQKAVTIKITHEQTPLKLIGMLPKTKNNQNSFESASGFLSSITASYGPYNTYIFPGLTYSIFQNKYTRNYKDFSVTIDHNLNGEQWSYRLSDEKGEPVTRKNTPQRLIHCLFKKYFCTRIIKLPQLATGSLLMPYIESVYAIDDDLKGKINFTVEIIQYLQDIKINKAYIAKTKEICGKKYFKLNLDLEKLDLRKEK